MNSAGLQHLITNKSHVYTRRQSLSFTHLDSNEKQKRENDGFQGMNTEICCASASQPRCQPSRTCSCSPSPSSRGRKVNWDDAASDKLLVGNFNRRILRSHGRISEKELHTQRRRQTYMNTHIRNYTCINSARKNYTYIDNKKYTCMNSKNYTCIDKNFTYIDKNYTCIDNKSYTYKTYTYKNCTYKNYTYIDKNYMYIDKNYTCIDNKSYTYIDNKKLCICA